MADQIQLGLQTIISRQTNISKAPAVITIGMIHGGTRYNIIPDSVQMDGTIRAFDQEVHKDIETRVKNTAELIAKSACATAEVTIVELYDVTVNDETLTERIVPTLSRAAQGQLVKMDFISGAEDFSFFGKEVPAFFFFLGITPKDRDPKMLPLTTAHPFSWTNRR